MHSARLFFLLFAFSPIFTNAQSPFVLGETLQIHSESLHESRTLNIWLPPGYGQDSTKKYPVIYLLDGSADEDFVHIVGLVQFGTFPWVNLLPESIVVGIANVDRRRDFTFPTHNAKDRANNPTTGGSEAFIRFIEAELQPFVRSHYAVDSLEMLIGQSLGGLLGAEILLKKPDLFTHYILVSPSLWWDDGSLLQREPLPGARVKTVYLAVGADEEPVMIHSGLQLAEKLRAVKINPPQLTFRILEGMNHGNILHPAVYDAFGKIFGK